MSKMSKKKRNFQATLAMSTNLSSDELRGLAPSMKKGQGQDTSELLEDSEPEIASEETLESETESGFKDPDFEFEDSDNSEELEPNEDIWPGDEVFDDEVAEALVPVMIVNCSAEPEATTIWCLSCRRIGRGDKRYLVPLLIGLEGYQDALELRFAMEIDHKMLYRQGLAYRVNLGLRSLLQEIFRYGIEPDYEVEDLGEFFRIFYEKVFIAMKEILLRYQKELELMPFASTSHYSLTTAPLGNAMLIEATTKEYGDKVERNLKLYALGDAPQDGNKPWKMKFSDARDLLDQRWLMSESFTKMMLKGMSTEALGKFFDGEEILADDPVGALEGAKQVMLMPVIWADEGDDINIPYGLVGGSGWQLSGEMIRADLGNFTLWYCPGRSTDAIMMKS